MNIHKGDEVVVICGKDKGKKGIVKVVFSKTSLVLVEGVNKVKRAMKIGQGNTENFVVKEKPIYSSKVKVVKKNKTNTESKGGSAKKKIKG